MGQIHHPGVPIKSGQIQSFQRGSMRHGLQRQDIPGCAIFRERTNEHQIAIPHAQGHLSNRIQPLGLNILYRRGGCHVYPVIQAVQLRANIIRRQHDRSILVRALE